VNSVGNCELFTEVISDYVAHALGGADFWIFWIFNRRQPAADVKCYYKTKVEKAFFFISCLPLRKGDF
jgi:hypothetical protein